MHVTLLSNCNKILNAWTEISPRSGVFNTARLVVTTVVVKNAVSWYVMPCSL